MLTYVAIGTLVIEVNLPGPDRDIGPVEMAQLKSEIAAELAIATASN